jgi:hypothetical protein
LKQGPLCNPDWSPFSCLNLSSQVLGLQMYATRPDFLGVFSYLDSGGLWNLLIYMKSCVCHFLDIFR